MEEAEKDAAGPSFVSVYGAAISFFAYPYLPSKLFQQSFVLFSSFGCLIILALHKVISSLMTNEKQVYVWISVLFLFLVARFLANAKFFASNWIRNRLEAHSSAQEALQQGIQSGCILRTELYDAYLHESYGKDGTATVESGLLFFPGALIAATAYTEIARKLSTQDKGFLVVVVSTEPHRIPSIRMGIDWNFLEKKILHDIEDRLDLRITRWAIGGHSMGAVLAAELITELLVKECNTSLRQKYNIDKLVMWGTYKMSDYGSQSTKIPFQTLVIGASEDAFYFKNEEEKEELLARFSSRDQVSLKIVEGGNHSGFGTYGPQAYPIKDGERKISLQKQHEEVAAITASFLKVK